MEIIDKKQKFEEEHKIKRSLLINFGVIIEGEAITHFIDPELDEIAWKLAQKCRSIICCRCNPLQKSEVVKFVKKHTNDIVLAIGDGGNDVNMIKVIPN
jgi:magnesium-transporting ATPase (P-type)